MILLLNALAAATGAWIFAPDIAITHFTLATPVNANLCRKRRNEFAKSSCDRSNRDKKQALHNPLDTIPHLAPNSTARFTCC